jgi:hypothetical protein
MNHMKKIGHIVYVDVDKEEILNRCHSMKIDRIVGMKSKTFSEILDYRREIYEKYYNYRIIVSNDESVENIAIKVKNLLERNQLYISFNEDLIETKYFHELVNRTDTLTNFFPIDPPVFTSGQLQRLSKMEIEERIARVIENFALGDYSPQFLDKIFDFKNLSLWDYKLKENLILVNFVKYSLFKCFSEENNFQILIENFIQFINLYLTLVRDGKIKFGNKLELQIKNVTCRFNLLLIIGFILCHNSGITISKIYIERNKPDSSLQKDFFNSLKKFHLSEIFLLYRFHRDNKINSINDFINFTNRQNYTINIKNPENIDHFNDINQQHFKNFELIEYLPNLETYENTRIIIENN